MKWTCRINLNDIFSVVWRLVQQILWKIRGNRLKTLSSVQISVYSFNSHSTRTQNHHPPLKICKQYHSHIVPSGDSQSVYNNHITHRTVTTQKICANCINYKKKNRILILHIKKKIFSFISDPKMLCKIKPNLFLSADDFCISVYCLP